jgi:hypothetical protein
MHAEGSGEPADSAKAPRKKSVARAHRSDGAQS